MQLLLGDIAVIVIAAAIFGYIMRLFKQPLIISYIIAGLVIGPFGLNYISNGNTILGISDLGITFLLFLVGMELNINRIKEVGKVVIFGGLVQIAFTAFFGGIIVYFTGFSMIESFYLGIVLAFSSTLVVVKYLSDSREIDSLHGRIIVGILVLQDIVAIMLVSVLPALQKLNLVAIGYSVMSGIALLVLAYILSRFVLSRIFDFSAKNSELLFLSSLALCFIFAYLATLIGFSVTIGAFLAGVMIANLPYSVDIIGRVKSLTTFFTALFFVALGMQVAPSSLPNILIPLLMLIILTIVLKPIIVFPIVYYFGYSKKTSFITALTLAQVSEFSLIIVAQGVALKQISQDLLSLIIALTVITMGISSYVVKYGMEFFRKHEQNFDFVDRLLKSKKSVLPETSQAIKDSQIIINGYENVGGTLLEKFINSGKNVLIVDNDPDVIRKLRETKMNCVYGDLAEQSVLEKLNLSKIEVIMSSIPDFHDSIFIIKKVREVNKKAIIIVTANRVSESFELYNTGADYVVIPHVEGEKQVAVLLEDFGKDISKVLSTKLSHIEQLKKRQSMKQQFFGQNGSFFQDIDNFIRTATNKLKESKEFIRMPQKAKKKAENEEKKSERKEGNIIEKLLNEQGKKKGEIEE